MKIALVLRSGGDYTATDVKWFYNQLPKGYEVICFTDMKFSIPGVTRINLLHDWSKVKGWWAKIELFRPDIEDDLFYFDLDTVITGDIRDLLDSNPSEMVMLKDFYHPEYLMSSMMYIPNHAKKQIWSAFWKDAKHYVNSCKVTSNWGDQGFLRTVLKRCVQWQDLFPGRFVSFKAGVAKVGESKWATERYSTGDGSLPQSADVVIFHGMPRPCQVDYDWIPAR